MDGGILRNLVYTSSAVKPRLVELSASQLVPCSIAPLSRTHPASHNAYMHICMHTCIPTCLSQEREIAYVGCVTGWPSVLSNQQLHTS